MLTFQTTSLKSAFTVPILVGVRDRAAETESVNLIRVSIPSLMPWPTSGAEDVAVGEVADKIWTGKIDRTQIALAISRVDAY